ncbi:conserved hypothetical protein [Talaromyces stipitatus ATCC 10500]|uniref:FAD-binding PCMH-type domain-containing protein n=1 Tax=Talaromyces stipitatus (strain ATCC 10500 / CBS 375.48 / QM 6759 / NRRL 1006) TaxID=441959 RepID=B8M5R7_TALSN|nr:uncharacterized protein TSTA_032950 [Talaromyces stipitatus ATCC 10500]EED20044.1 conserved hypothetical protein [Talaromyces stipitatus ATCC 10500]
MSGRVLFLVVLFSSLGMVYSLALANAMACGALAILMPEKVFNSNTASYTAALTSYFSRQEQEVKPECVVIPQSTNDVSEIVATMTAFAWIGAQFAVRGGGHSIYAGAANIQGGVTIDLSSLNEVTVSPDKSTVDLGPGGKWGAVYEVLDPLQITVSGGRDSDVGVGGYLLGGGMSYIGPLAGWACDNVVEYEVVLADGKVVNVNNDSYPDLFLALKGGGNNFGIVTRFTLKTHPLGNFWGGFLVYPITSIGQQIDSLSKFLGTQPYDPYAAMIQSWGYSSEMTVISDGIYYTQNVQSTPAVYQDFVDNSTLMQSSLRTSNMSSFAAETDKYQAYSMRQGYYTTSFLHTPSIYSTIYDIFNTSLTSVSKVQGINWYLTIQATPALNGTNSLGLKPGNARLINVLLTTCWSNASDDAAVAAAAKSLISSIESATRAAGVYQNYKYYNYADISQEVISGYGSASVEELRTVSKKYDVYGVFQNSVPGGFKLW